MTSIVTARDVAFEFSNGHELFKNLNFSLDSKITALVGPNGVGKTCLARLVAGELEPTLGSLQRSGGVALLRQREAPPSVTVEAFLSDDYTWSLLGERLLEGLVRQSSCAKLSGGQWMRVRLARALEERFLILDEPTNDLDREGRRAVFQFLREHDEGVLLISHDRECLRLCDEVLELSNRGLAKFSGGWDAYAQAKEQERAALARALEGARRERDAALLHRSAQRERQEKRLRQGAAAAKRGGMPKILLGGRKRRAQVTTGKIDSETMDRANATVRDLHLALSELKVDPVMYADLMGQEIPAQKLVAEARAFNIRFQDWIYRLDLDFSWRGNIRMALKGANGSGKSTLLKALLGETFETRGELRRGNLAALYIDQGCAFLDERKSIFENVREVSKLSESEIRNGLARFLFMKEAVFQKTSELSGGERLRAALARGFLAAEKPELLILDEPTNNLDLGNVEFLEGLVSEFRGALVAISHDETFLRNCGVTQVLDL